jgi:predicted nucleic acid-binding protein
MTIFVLDTNVISDIVSPKPNPNVLAKIAVHRQDVLCLCDAVDYEVRRGYLKTNATTRLQVFQLRIKPQFQWTPVTEADWRQAAQFWADAVIKGKQLSDVDLVLAAVAYRTGAVIVSADDDFDALNVNREDWRIPMSK